MADPERGPAENEPTHVFDAMDIQILATEHWGMLASRSMIWNEMFARAGMFITVLSASIVSMALIAQATGFDDNFLVFSSLVLAVTLLLGIATMIRLGDALEEDIWLLQGMNRLRNAYLHASPDLKPWFSLGHHDDMAGILLSVGPERQVGGVGRILSAAVATVGVLNCLLAGVILALVTDYLTGSSAAGTVLGIAGTLLAGAFVLAIMPARGIRRGMAMLHPRFPTLPVTPTTHEQQADLLH